MPIQDLHTIQEFHDLLALSALDQELKLALTEQVNKGTMTPETFAEVISLLREEDRLDKDIQRYGTDLANFDTDGYLNSIQQVVDEEVKKRLKKS
ncbi:MAG: hypothetical protein HY817_02705 [Candidatus Abawacabacteria bacterium]|nr:hypothetical protein [Candidatus Abawacabacteria bacterium]